MAEFNIHQWKLAALRVRLDISARRPTVTSELEGFPDGNRTKFWSRTDPLEAFGLANTVQAPTQLQCPDELRDAVAQTLTGELDGEAALWLRLVPPYGYLGAVPWEETLTEAMSRPVLRVPDRLPVPSDAGSVWTMAIVVNAAVGATWAPDHIVGLLEKLPHIVEPKSEVDVFCDAATYAALLPRLPAANPDRLQINVHDPAGAALASQRRAARAAPPYPDPRQRGARGETEALRRETSGLRWADWIVEGLAGRAVRDLHLVAEAVFDGGRPLLAIRDDPARPTASAYVGADDLFRLADRLGAPSLSFGSPPENSSDVAVRVMADSLGQQRPGPTWYSSLARDPDATWLIEAFAFLANDPERARLPKHSSLFAYLQPAQIRPFLQQSWPDLAAPDDVSLQAPSPEDATGSEQVARAVADQAEVPRTYTQGAVVPAWVASSERFIDSGVAALLKSGGVSQLSVPERQSYQEGVAQALDELRELVARHSEGT